MKASPKNSDLSVIILNYNSGQYLAKCLESLQKSNLQNYQVEYIVVDNASTDQSIDLSKKVKLDHTKYLILDQNLGFAAGNNQGVKISNPKSKYILFLNPDTTVNTDTLAGMISFFDHDSQVDAATCYIELALTGKLQPESHRGFPNPWNTFWHFFGFGLPKVFPKSKIFNGYFLGHLDYTKVQVIDACVGAFLMVRHKVGDTIGWWNEKYFFYGEDLDFCYQLRQHGFRLYFNPQFKIIHYQGVSSGIIGHSKKLSNATRQTKVRSAKASTQAMRIFYELNLLPKYPVFLRGLVMGGIGLLEQYRLFKAKYL